MGRLLKFAIVSMTLAALFLVVLPSNKVQGDAVDLYWVGGTGNWTDSAHWSIASGGAGGHAAPTSTNAVFFDGNSTGTVTISTGTSYACKSIDFTGSGANSLVFACTSSSSVTGLNVYGDFIWDDGVTFLNWGTNDYISMRADGTIDSDGSSDLISPGSSYRNGPEWIINAVGATVDMTDSFKIAYYSWVAGTFDLNGQTLQVNYQFDGGDQTYSGTVEFYLDYETDYYLAKLYGDNTFEDLKFTNTDKYDGVSLYGDQTITSDMFFNGAAIDNRLYVASNTSTQRTITAANVVATFTDFNYIIGAGGGPGDWDLDAVGEDAIDFGNCFGITFAYPYSAVRDYYWIGDSDTYAWFEYAENRASYNWSTTSGGAAGAARLPPPTATNDVYFDANSGFAVGHDEIWFTTDVVCQSMDWTGSTAVTTPKLYSSSGSISIYGDLILAAGMDGKYSVSGNTNFIFCGSGDITTNAVEFGTGFGDVEIDCGAGTYTLQDDLYLGGDAGGLFTYTSGTLDTNGQTIYMTGTKDGGFYGGGQDYDELYITRVGTTTIYGENDFGDFTCIAPTAVFTNALKFAADQYIDNLDWEGYSQVYRLTVGSNTPGTQRQISVSTSTYVIYCNISDIAGVGAASWDISYGYNSDMGGNLGITFTTPIYVYWVGNSGSWSDYVNHWADASGGTPGTGRVPLIHDIAVFDENSFTIPGRTITFDMTDISAIDAADCLYTPTFSKAGTVDIYGGVILGTCTWTVTSTYFKGFDSGLTSSSVMTTNLYIEKNEGFMSSLYLGSNVTVVGTVYLRSGILNCNGWDLTSYVFDSNTTTYDRVFRMGSGTYTLNGTAAGNKWNISTTKFTLECETSTLKLSNSGVTGQTWDSEGLTYNNVTMAGTGVWTLTVTGSPSVFALTIDRSDANKTISGSITITMQQFVLDISGTNTITITNTDFSMASGVVLGDYLVISGSAAAGGATFFANVGGHSVNNGGNSGWIWTPPVAPTVQTNAATDVTEAGATLNGELLTTGSYIYFTCYFQYGPTVGYGWETYNPDILTGVDIFDARITPYHAYHYRAVVEFGLNDHAYGNDMTVSIVGGLKQAKAAVGDPGAEPGDILVTVAPDAIPNMYDEGDTGGIPFAPIIDPLLGDNDIPVEVFWYPVAFIMALGLGFAAYGKTKDLKVQALVSGMVMAGFCGGGVLGTGLLPYLTVVVFVIEAILLIIIQEKQYA